MSIDILSYRFGWSNITRSIVNIFLTYLWIFVIKYTHLGGDVGGNNAEEQLLLLLPLALELHALFDSRPGSVHRPVVGCVRHDAVVETGNGGAGQHHNLPEELRAAGYMCMYSTNKSGWARSINNECLTRDGNYPCVTVSRQKTRCNLINKSQSRGFRIGRKREPIGEVVK